MPLKVLLIHPLCYIYIYTCIYIYINAYINIYIYAQINMEHRRRPDKYLTQKRDLITGNAVEGVVITPSAMYIYININICIYIHI